MRSGLSRRDLHLSEKDALRRTKATLIYRKTGNLRAVRFHVRLRVTPGSRPSYSDFDQPEIARQGSTCE